MVSRLVLSLTSVALAACQTPQGAPVATGELAGLPLTAEARSELSVLHAYLASETARRSCTPRELQHLRAAMTLFAVYSVEDETAPWTGAQQQRVDALRRQWEALGGDAFEPSPACMALPAM